MKGLTYKNSSEIVVNNIDQPYIHDLDIIPFGSKVYKKHLNIKNYYYGSISVHKNDSFHTFIMKYDIDIINIKYFIFYHYYHNIKCMMVLKK